MIEAPETKYAVLGEDHIAYQVFGGGDLDLIWVPSSGDCIDMRWEWPAYASFLSHLAEQARVIMFDLRGSGSSDSPSGEALPSWERWADEAKAVLDAVSSERAVIFGFADSGPTAILFAATHPGRTRGLILACTSARFAGARNYPGEVPVEVGRGLQEYWGNEEVVGRFSALDAAADPAYRRWAARNNRLSLPPKDARRHIQYEMSVDVRHVLPSVRVPTLVLHREGWNVIPPEHGRYLADHIPGARFSLLPGRDGVLYTEPTGEVLKHIDDFLAGLHETAEPNRALAAVLFTDIVESTARAAALGDRQWRHLLETHDAVARTVVEQHHGRLVKMTGDGMLATFDGPGRAIRCAIALGDALRPLGLDIRAGLHTGEVEVMGTDIAGIGVHIAARVLEAASPGEVAVSAAVPMLVAGSGLDFEDRGDHELKGVPGTWKLFAVKG